MSSPGRVGMQRTPPHPRPLSHKGRGERRPPLLPAPRPPTSWVPGTRHPGKGPGEGERPPLPPSWGKGPGEGGGPWPGEGGTVNDSRVTPQQLQPNGMRP